MAKSTQSVESLMRATFPIQVAVRTTEAVEQICSKNNMKFFELLKPFCALSSNGECKIRCFKGECGEPESMSWNTHCRTVKDMLISW